MPTLEELHNAYMATREVEYDDKPDPDEQFQVFNDQYEKESETMAQIYVKSDDNNDNTSILVTDDKGNNYFSDVMNVPEITGIHRAVSFVKHNLADFQRGQYVDVFTDKLDAKDVMNDAYVRYTRLPIVMGTELTKNEKSEQYCKNELYKAQRWDMLINRKGNER